MTGAQRVHAHAHSPDVDSAHSARKKITRWRWLCGILIQAGRARVIIYLCCVSQPRAATFSRQPPTHRPGDGWVRFATEMAPHALHLNCNWLRFFLGTFSIYSATGHEWWVFYGHDEKYFQPQDSRCAKESDGPALFFAGQRILALSRTQRGLLPHGD